MTATMEQPAGPRTDAVEILRRDLIGNNPALAAEYERVRDAMRTARDLSWLREANGLTHAQMAARTGYPVRTILEAEEGDYEGNLDELLHRAMQAVNPH